MNGTLVTLAVFPSRFEAECARERLASSKILSFVSADDAGGMRPAPFSYAFGAELVVRAEDASRSREILGMNEEAPSA